MLMNGCGNEEGVGEMSPGSHNERCSLPVEVISPVTIAQELRPLRTGNQLAFTATDWKYYF